MLILCQLPTSYLWPKMALHTGAKRGSSDQPGLRPGMLSPSALAVSSASSASSESTFLKKATLCTDTVDNAQSAVHRVDLQLFGGSKEFQRFSFHRSVFHRQRFKFMNDSIMELLHDELTNKNDAPDRPPPTVNKHDDSFQHARYFHAIDELASLRRHSRYT